MDKSLEFTPYRRLNEPESFFVSEDSSGLPITVGRGKLKVKSIEDRWRIDDEWWRQEPISRMYYSVILDNGRNLTIYKDLIKGHWFQQQYRQTTMNR